MLATSQADMENLHRLIMTDSSLVNRKDFINGYTAMHWAAKQGRCDIIAALAMNGAIVDLKSVSVVYCSILYGLVWVLYMSSL